MASASTDDLACIASLDCPRARCGSGHASLRAFAAAHTTARATFGTSSTLGTPRPAPSPDIEGDDEDGVNVSTTRGTRSMGDNGVQCCVHGSPVDGLKSGARPDANVGASAGADGAPNGGVSNVGDGCGRVWGGRIASDANHGQGNAVDAQTSSQSLPAFSPITLLTTVPSQKGSYDQEQNHHVGTSVPDAASCPVLPKNGEAPGLSTGAPASTRSRKHPARSSYHSPFNSLSHSVLGTDSAWTGTCLIEATTPSHSSSTAVYERPSRDSSLFGPNVPLDKSKPYGTTAIATPKRPREIPNIDDIASLLSKCKANDPADDVQRAAELLSSLQVPGKRPRRHEGCPNFLSSPPKSEQSVVSGREGLCELEDPSQPHASDLAEDDDNELSFLVTNCDIDADSRSTQFMPYIA
jgi:hypothetical protein